MKTKPMVITVDDSLPFATTVTPTVVKRIKKILAELDDGRVLTSQALANRAGYVDHATCNSFARHKELAGCCTIHRGKRLWGNRQTITELERQVAAT